MHTIDYFKILQQKEERITFRFPGRKGIYNRNKRIAIPISAADDIFREGPENIFFADEKLIDLVKELRLYPLSLTMALQKLMQKLDKKL